MSQPPFLPCTLFHVYNHANGDEDLFRNPSNYVYFLKKYAEYLGPVVDTFAYCLMPNHFHLMVRVKAEVELRAFAEEKERLKQERLGLAAIPSATQNFHSLQDFESLVCRQFKNFSIAYAKALNIQQNRKGSLLMPNLRRKPVEDDRYFTRLLIYIHQNPTHHGFTPDFRTWPHSSYRALLSEQPTQLRRNEVLGWFGTKNQFRLAHDRSVNEAESLLA